MAVKVWTKREFQGASSGGVFATRKGPVIDIDAALDAYHRAGPLEFKAQLVALVVAAESAKRFLAALGGRPNPRRLGVLTLYAQALARSEEIVNAQTRRAKGNWQRAAAATKPVRVPVGSGAKAIDEKYWTELAAPHYATHESKKVFEDWKRSPTHKNFADWVKSEYLPAAMASGDYPQMMKAKTLNEKQVRYLDAEARGDFEVQVRGGLVIAPVEQKFHTGTLTTAFSGSGWAIFVMSTEGKVYTGSHDTGKFHHSSFLSGLPVVAAGEWAVDQGRVRAVTAKSGHYKPTPAMFNRMLDWLANGGVNLLTVAVKPQPWDRAAKWNPAMHVWKAGGKTVDVTIRAPKAVPAGG